MSVEAFSLDAHEYFRARGIDPQVAAEVGVRESREGLAFPYVADDGEPFWRRRSLNGAGVRVRQPKGRPLTTWWPDGRPEQRNDMVLVTEGESDALAAVSALRVAPAGLPGLPVVAIPGTGYPRERLAEELGAAGVRHAWLGLDADQAGRDYTDRLIPVLLAAGVKPSKVELPEGHDLAECLAAAEDDRGRGEWLANMLFDAEAVGGEATEEAGQLFEAVGSFVGRYVVLPGNAETDMLALFVAHTHAIEAAHATPYLIVLSPEKRTGKSLLLEVLELLVSRPWRMVSPSEAAMYRKIEQDRPTLLLDEVDAIFTASNGDRTEALRGILNAGNRPGAAVPRCVGEGAKQRVVDFNVFGPKVLAGIDTGRLPDTIRDRGIELGMKRKTSSEDVERFRWRYAEPAAAALRERLEGWADQVTEELREAEPHLPDQLNDRTAEAWEPLLAIADHAGGDWPRRARSAAVALAEGADIEDATRGTRVLVKLAELLADRSSVTTEEVLDSINTDDELPFGGWRDGKGLDARGLARLLKPYGPRPRTVKLSDGSTAKGYRRDDTTEDAFARYLPGPSPASRPSPDAQVTLSEAASEPEGDGGDGGDGPSQTPLGSDGWGEPG